MTPGFTSPLTANVALNAQFPLNWGNATLRGRVGYTHEDGKYNFSSSVGSPFNEQIKGDDIDLIDAQIGIDGIPLGTSEGEVRLWVKNLTNAKDFVRSIDYGQLGFAGGYYAEPRTYGITLGAKF